MEPLSTATVTAGGAALTVVLQELYETAKGTAKAHLKRIQARRRVEGLYKKAADIRRVKTIWQIDRAVDLYEFYCPTKISLRADSHPAVIDDICNFGEASHVVIRGTVGQGKSIFLRHLASRELVKGQKIPVFMELRRIRSSESLIDAIERELVSLGFWKSRELTEFLLGSGKICLFLDAFDEIESSASDRILSEIEHVVRAFHCDIYTTTRPETAVCLSNLFSVVDMQPLSPGEYEVVVRKVCGAKETAEAIIRGVKESGGSVQEVLTTPLMVALLVVRFRAEQSVPETRAAFYEGLFLLLLSRHDKSKAGYTRERRCLEGDSVFEEFFDSLCFETRKHAQSPIGRPDMVRLAKLACERSGVKTGVDDILYDVCKITCLLLEEGGEYRYIHKSVEEFHAARRIVRLPESESERIYKRLRSDQKWSAWRGELSFLEVTDRYRFSKYFVIPDMCSLIGVETSLPVPTDHKAVLEQKEAFARKLGVALDWYHDEKRGGKVSIMMGFTANRNSWSAHEIALRDLLQGIKFESEEEWRSMAESVAQSHTPHLADNQGHDRDMQRVTLYDIANGSSLFSPIMQNVLEMAFDLFILHISDVSAYVDNVEHQSRLVDL